MSFNIASLPAYTDQTSTDLITRAILKPQTVNHLTVRAGLTAGTTAIQVLGSQTDIKDASCGFGAGQVGTNSTIFSQVDMNVQAKMLKELLCPDVLYNVYLSSQLSASALHETVPFEQQIADIKIKEIAKYVEETIWAGDGANLDGLLFQTSVAEGGIDGTAYAPAWSATNSVANMWALIDLIPTELKQEDDLTAYVSYATYSKLVQGLQKEGNSILLQYPNVNNVTGAAESSFVFPGSNVVVFAAPGLVDEAGKSSIVLGPKKYAFFGTGLINDESTFRFAYQSALDEVSFMSKFKVGTAAIANQFVSTVA